MLGADAESRFGSEMRRVLVVAPYFPPAQHAGGPVRSIVAMLRCIPDGFETSVVTRNCDIDSAAPLVNPADEIVEWAPGVVVRYMMPKSLRSAANALLGVRRWRPEIVFLNSFLDPLLSIAIQMLAAIKFLHPRLLLLAPRGEFSDGALRLKPRKKAAYIWVYKRLRLHRRVVWVASTEHEATDIIRTMDPTARIIIRRNDVELPMRADRPPERAASDRLRLIHIGRCVPKKGLDIALEALKSVEAPVDLDIFGHEEDRSYTDRCKRIAAELSNESRVRFAGHIHTDNVRDTIRVYDAVLVPTLGENFGHVIAEALSVSCPVMVSDNTPWSETVRRGGGSVVAPNTPQSWAKAIDDYFRAGLMGWADAHTQAGAAYEDWFATTLNQPHLFELAVRVMLELDRNSQGRPH